MPSSGEVPGAAVLALLLALVPSFALLRLLLLPRAASTPPGRWGCRLDGAVGPKSLGLGAAPPFDMDVAAAYEVKASGEDEVIA